MWMNGGCSARNSGVSKLVTRLGEDFSFDRSEAFLVESPHRICPLGAHVDHQGGAVTGMTVDRGIDEVSSDGGGSSFSGQDFQNRASDMPVLHCWRQFVDDPEYVAAFDEETVELSRRIFGDVTKRNLI